MTGPGLKLLKFCDSIKLAENIKWIFLYLTFGSNLNFGWSCIRKSGRDWYLGPRGGNPLLVQNQRIDYDDSASLPNIFIVKPTSVHCRIWQSTTAVQMAGGCWRSFVFSRTPCDCTEICSAPQNFCGTICSWGGETRTVISN